MLFFCFNYSAMADGRSLPKPSQLYVLLSLSTAKNFFPLLCNAFILKNVYGSFFLFQHAELIRQSSIPKENRQGVKEHTGKQTDVFLSWEIKRDTSKCKKIKNLSSKLSSNSKEKTVFCYIMQLSGQMVFLLFKSLHIRNKARQGPLP